LSEFRHFDLSTEKEDMMAGIVIEKFNSFREAVIRIKYSLQQNSAGEIIAIMKVTQSLNAGV
jgi:hypothetical protein